MVYGPCGGVTAAGGCEVDAALPCPFVDAPTVRWAGAAHRDACAAQAGPAPGATAAPRPGARQRPDRGAPMRRPAWPRGRSCSPTCRRRRWTGRRSCAAPTCSADGVDAVLIGDHPGARVQFPPSYRALLLRDRGVARLGGAELPRPQPGRPGGRARRARRRGRGRGALRHGRPHRDRPPPRRRAGVRPRRHPPGGGWRGRRACWCRWRSRRARRPPTDVRPGWPRRCGRARRCAS